MEHERNCAKIIAEKINEMIPNIKSGSLRFYGEWFGRPMDNIHQITKAENSNNVLIIHFMENEILSIISPELFQISDSAFVIKKSNGLIWQWYYYGLDKIAKNLMVINYFVDNIKNDEIIISEGNITNKKANINELAFEIC